MGVLLRKVGPDPPPIGDDGSCDEAPSELTGGGRQYGKSSLNQAVGESGECRSEGKSDQGVGGEGDRPIALDPSHGGSGAAAEEARLARGVVEQARDDFGPACARKQEESPYRQEVEQDNACDERHGFVRLTRRPLRP